MAGDPDVVSRLLDEGADPDEPLVLGLTPLQRAANRDAADVAKALIEGGAEIGATGQADQTALHIAARADSVETLKVLLEAGADPTSRSSDGMNALDAAAHGGAIGALEILASLPVLDIDAPSAVITQGHGYPRDIGPTPLAIAVRADQLEAVRRLIELGADVDAESDSEHTPILTSVFFDSAPEVIETLLAAGADPEASASCEQGCSIGGGEPLTAREWAMELRRDQLIVDLLTPP